jgi:sodium-independent sulfate anion transporter 11
VKDIEFGPSDGEKSVCQRAVNKSLWLISTARNIIVVVACGALAFVLKARDSEPFVLTGMQTFIFLRCHIVLIKLGNWRE